MNPKLYPAILFLLGLAAISGCSHVSTTAERDASFAPYAKIMVPDVNLGGKIDLRSYIAFRTALVLVSSAKPSSFGLGSAAAVDGRGYYLTAAHAVSGNTAILQVWCQFPRDLKVAKPAMAVVQAEVVWCGDVSKGDPDLALLYTSRPPEWIFEWSSEIKLGEAAVAAGPNYEKFSVGGLSSGASGGKLLSSETRTTSNPPWSLLTSTLPVHGGDSGGPLANSTGHLLGINYQVWSLTLLHVFPPRTERAWKSNSIRPDLDWLRRIIEQDYAKRPNAPAIAAFWRRPDSGVFLARTLLDGLYELEAARLASGAPEDNRSAYKRQELVRKILADHAGLADPSFLPVVNALPRMVATDRVSPVSPAEFDKFAAVLRERLQMN